MYQPGDDASHLIAGEEPAVVVQHPENISCRTCREMFICEEIPFPSFGDYCEDCVLHCDRCEEALSERDMVRIQPGVVACPDCAPRYSREADDGPDEDIENERMTMAWANWRAEA